MTAFGLGVRLALAWRLDVVTRLLGGALVLALNGHLWLAVAGGHAAVGGRSVEALMTYVVAAWVVAAVARNTLDRELGARTQTGEILADLLRPGSLALHLWARDLGRAAVSLVLTGAPLVALGALWFPVALPGGPAALAAFAVSAVLGHAVAVGLGLVVGGVALRAGRADGLVHLRGIATALLSGALVPLDVYPHWLAAFARASPFAAIADAPARLLVDGTAPLSVLGPQAGWAAVTLGLGAVALSWARRMPAVRGG